MATILNISSHSLESFIHYNPILQALSLSFSLPAFPHHKALNYLLFSHCVIIMALTDFDILPKLILFHPDLWWNDSVPIFFLMYLYPKCTIQHSRETLCVCVRVFVCVCVRVCVCVGMRDSLVQCTRKIRLGDTECLSRWENKTSNIPIFVVYILSEYLLFKKWYTGSISR